MNRKRYRMVAWGWVLAGLMLFLGAGAHAGELPVSGQLVNGLRYLRVPAGEATLHYKVYRGDYIKFDLAPDDGPMVLTVPDLGIQQQLVPGNEPGPYFKMKTTSRFGFSLGDRSGVIDVVDYKPNNYRELTAAEAARFLEREKPIILDVRTPREYKQGHLAQAVLIPVQELQRRLAELSAYRDREILVYCATGNRSTVASKIMIDKGFTRITNLRYGIVDWQRREYPVVR